MFKLIIKIVLILLPLIVLTIALELYARKIPTTYSTKLSYFNKKKSQIEILVMGSSHSNFGINPKYFDREAFNFSNMSQSLYQDYKILLKYLPECKNIKMVIIPVSYFTLQSDLASSPEAWRCAYYSLYMGVKADESASMFELKNHSAIFLWDGPLGTIYNLQHIKYMEINEYGYQTPEKKQSTVEKTINDSTGKARVVFHDSIMNYDLLEMNIILLNKIADELTRRKIKLVIVTTPVYKTYYNNINKTNYEIMTNTIEMIVKQYSATSVNYINDTRFELNDFWDNDHLNEEGAKKFSLIVKQDIIDKYL